MTAVSLLGAASYMPQNVVPNEFFTGGVESKNPMFRGAKTRHHVSSEETASFMVEKATTRLADKLNLNLEEDVDILLTNVTCLDMPFTGNGAGVSHALGMKPKWIMDVHNAGCVSFIYMMRIAKALIESGQAKNALICNVQNTAGRVFSHPELRNRPQSAVPGDGCGVGYLAASSVAPIKSICAESFGEYAGDMRAVNELNEDWWQPRKKPMYVDFSENKVGSIVMRGNRLVPQMMYQACAEANIDPSDIGVMVTNQPNPVFLRNWREAMLLQEDQHVNTYEEHGNLFGAAIPIGIERALDQGKLNYGDHLVLGGFSHAGDYAASAVIEWKMH